MKKDDKNRLVHFPFTYFLINFIPFLLLLLIGGRLLYRSEYSRLVNKYQSANVESVSTASLILETDLQAMRRDMIWLQDFPKLKHALDDPSANNIRRLAERFAGIAGIIPSLFQIRWIDAKGQERVRVDVNDGKVGIVPAAQLQDKSKRDYFLRTMASAPGEIYVSRLDLNVENNRIVTPYQPTIRVAIKLVNAKNVPMGILVMNYWAKNLIEQAIKVVEEQETAIILLDEDGYYLYNIDHKDEWGRDLQEKKGLQYADPALWQTMSERWAGDSTNAEGLWSWRSVELYSPVVPARHDGYRLIVASQVPFRIVEADMESPKWELIRLGGLLLLFSLGITLSLTRARMKMLKLSRISAQKAVEAEASNLARASFLSNMSHEIRTPLNAILGLVYVLEKKPMPAEDKNMLRKVRNAGKSLLGIINDVLDLSKLESGNLELEDEPFNLNDLLDNLATTMFFCSQDKDIDLVITPPETEVNPAGDALRLEQVLTNLCANAVKFTDHGHVELKIDIVESLRQEVVLRFSVIDTGIGIAGDVQEKIFAPFGQADVSTTRHYGGTGLGLAIARQLVEKMGGRLQVHSELGRGSRFWFEVRFKRVAEPLSGQLVNRNIHVLIVDDNDIARRSLSQVVKALGWQPTALASGQAVMEYLSAPQYGNRERQIFLVDWQMPGMDGLATARAIRANTGAENRPPILVMVTGFGSQKIERHPDFHLVDAVLSKPVTVSTLYDAVARLMDNRRDPIQPKPMPNQNQPGNRLADTRLLIVDDSEINLEVAKQIFTDEGATVFSFSNPEKAIQWLTEHPAVVDLVLMDIQMPEMDGYEATARIHEVEGLKSLPVVALTAGVMRPQVKAARNAGMVEFLAKPFNVDIAVGVIRKIIDRQYQSFPPHASSTAEQAVLPFSCAEFSAIDLRAGLSVWKNRETYLIYLNKFRDDYRSAVNNVASLSKVDAGRFLHKLKGAAANLGMIQVANSAESVECLLLDDADITAELQVFAAALALAFDEIRKLEETVPEKDRDAPQVVEDPLALKIVLQDLLRLLDQRNPDLLRPHLEKAALYLSAEQLSTIRHAADDFDFQLVERTIRQIGKHHQIFLEE